MLASGNFHLIMIFFYITFYISDNKYNSTGDLTDAKAKDKMGSKQILEEWQYYKHVLDETEVTKKTLWLDVRGNHGRNNNI